MPVAPIVGKTIVSIGYTTLLSDETPDGVWSSSDVSIATIGATGIVTGINLGTTIITYTAGIDEISIPLQVNAVQISNGFNLDRVLPSFKGRLGWHQPSTPGMPVLSTENKTALSGRYFDRGFHKASTIQNYYDTQEYPTITDDDFNQLLQDEYEGAILRCINAVFNKPQLIEHQLLYTRTANMRQIPIPNQGNFCGYRINMGPGDYAINIDSIALYFNGITTFNIYLFCDLVQAPIQQKEVVTVANSQTRIQLDWVVNYLNTGINGNTGGVWYIGYFQDDLGDVLALDEQLNLWADSKIWGAYPFQTPAVIGQLDFNRINPSINFRSFGINLEISSYRDYTQTICQNAQLFDEPIGLAMAINVLDQIKSCTRSNGLERINALRQDKLDLELNLAFPTQDFPFMSGLRKQLERALTTLWKKFNPDPVAMSIPIGNSNYWWGDRSYQGMDIGQLYPRENAY